MKKRVDTKNASKCIEIPVLKDFISNFFGLALCLILQKARKVESTKSCPLCRSKGRVTVYMQCVFAARFVHGCF